MKIKIVNSSDLCNVWRKNRRKKPTTKFVKKQPEKIPEDELMELFAWCKKQVQGE